MPKKFIIIGDVHGRSVYKKIIENFNEDYIYVFVGDYTDPYPHEYISELDCIDMMYHMFDFKMKHPDNVIILIGNHDAQYMRLGQETNRYSHSFANAYNEIFRENKDLIHGVAYNIGNKYLITHAGVSKIWYENHIDKDYNSDTLDIIADKINKLWSDNPQKFAFRISSDVNDYYGISPEHGPLWVRPYTLWQYNLFGFDTDKIQIVGHTSIKGNLQTDENGKIYIDNSTDGHINTMSYTTKPLTPEEYRNRTGYILTPDEKNKICILNNPKNIDPQLIFIDALEESNEVLEIKSNKWKIKTIK